MINVSNINNLLPKATEEQLDTNISNQKRKLSKLYRNA